MQDLWQHGALYNWCTINEKNNPWFDTSWYEEYDGKCHRELFAGYIASESEKGNQKAKRVCEESKSSLHINAFSTQVQQDLDDLLNGWNYTFIHDNPPVKRPHPITTVKCNPSLLR